MTHPRLSRRDFLACSALALAGASVNAAEVASADREREPIIDIHQHTNYSGRTNQQLLAHQRAMGVTTTILLPAGRLYGLDAGCGGNQTVVDFAREHPGEFVYFANEVADLPEAREEITRYLKQGAIGIGEQKFKVESDSPHIEKIAEIAKEFRVPILLHFQHETYNLNFPNFHKTLRKFPTVNFIGHAQTWWGNVDRALDPKVLYPKGRITPGGLTDQWLAEYPNLFADLSAGSGLNALLRDEEFTKDFFARHQDKLLYGSDCNDTIGRGEGCQGAQTIATIRRLAPSKAIERKLLFGNSKKLFKF